MSKQSNFNDSILAINNSKRNKWLNWHDHGGSYLASKDASSTGSLNSSLGLGAEELCLDNNRDLWKSASAQDLVESALGDIDDWGLGGVLGVFKSGWLREETPKLVDVNSWAELSVEVSSENSDTGLTEVSGVALLVRRLQFEEVRSLVSETSGLTSTGRVLSVLSNSTVSVRDVTSQLSAFSFSGSLDYLPLPF
jgi:hypothetical protein